ncbi:MAG: tRNA pseudouridine(55) synthase TruB [Alphaproteobacteria bacterium]|nr:tRNA pseudouridine(55) synthase TruB [Alphaproteobacteria bacterium]
MARRKKGDPVHGWVVIDKPAGLTSTDVVTRVRRALNAQKAGHAGTLDPLATGILAVALGEATKTIPFVMDAEKVYRFTVRWGEARATDDAEGEVVATCDKRPSREEILIALPEFTGEIAQVPPAFSAVKVDGERAYDLARAGETVELKARPVWIGEILIIAQPDADHAEFEMLCGKGTYVRSFARDLAQRLGTVGHVSALRRLRAGPFSEDQAISLDNFMTSARSPDGQTALLPLKTALDDIPALAVAEGDAARLRSGQSVLVRGRTFIEAQQLIEDGGVPVVLATGLRGDPIALTELDRGELRPVRVFNLSTA